MKKIVIATHFLTYGKSQAFYNYLKKHTKHEVLYISHPILGNVFTWAIGAIDTFYQVLKTSKKYDIYFGSNDLNASIGLILRKIGTVKKVIYYNDDSPPNRFNNRLVNRFYHWLDLYCVKQADYVWNNSERMVIDREKKGLPKKYRAKQIEVPMGLDKYSPKPFRDINPYHIGFSGHLAGERGIELLITIANNVHAYIPQMKLIVIGDGPILDTLKTMADPGAVTFLGHIYNPQKVRNILSKCAIGIAPYKPDSYMAYTDPAKIKVYLSAGLPVITTHVPAIAKDIQKLNCGVVVDFNQKKLETAIEKCLLDSKKLKLMRKNVHKLAKKYEYKAMFDKAFSKVV